MNIPWPKTREAQREAIIFLGLGAVFLVFLIPALREARQEYRDGLRRAQLREVKVVLEQWNNDHQAFPLHPAGNPHTCGVSTAPDDWLFHTILVTDRTRAPARDPFHSRGWAFRYCPTNVTNGKGDVRGTSGFILDARLENTRAPTQGFNTEHNILERVLTENSETHYRICGGDSTECGTRQVESSK